VGLYQRDGATGVNPFHGALYMKESCSGGIFPWQTKLQVFESHEYLAVTVERKQKTRKVFASKGRVSS